MNLSDHLAKLLWIIPPVAIYNLLLMTDVLSISLLPEVELVSSLQALMIDASMSSQDSFNLLPNVILFLVFKSYGLEEFALRLPGIGLIIAVVFVWWFYGRKLLGEGLVTAGILVVCSSLLLPNIIKFATSDAWVLSFQMLNWLSVLYLLKKPKLVWQILFYLSLILGLLTSPFVICLWVITLLCAYHFLHKEGKKLKFNLLVSIILSALGVIFLEDSPLLGSYSYLGILGNLQWQLLGVLPWFGFILAGLKETYDKLRKKEEFAVLMLGAIVASVISGGVMLQWVLAVLAGKQLISYFHPKYPYGDWVRGGAVMVVVLVCLFATTSMIWGYAQLSYTGYRAFMMSGGLFWVVSFLGVIGLYIRNHRMITLGFMMSGLLLNFSFWYRLVPVAELSQGWSKRGIEQIAACDAKPIPDRIIIYSDEEDKGLSLYAKNNFQKVTFQNLEELPDYKSEKETAVLIVAENSNLIPSIPITFDTLAYQATFWHKMPMVLYQDHCK